MNKLYNEIINDVIELRKAKDEMASFGITVISKINELTKNDMKDGILPEISDNHVIKAINSFLKTSKENIELLKNNIENKLYVTSKKEIELLTKWMPKMASEEEIENEIKQFFDNFKEEKSPKIIGVILKELNSKFGSLFDTQLASSLIKKYL